MSHARHFSMIRGFHLADAFTLANAFAGTGAIVSLMQYLLSGDRGYLWLALALLPVALVMDVSDGRVARALGRPSALGQELDSLADLVSFGVAPAALGFAVGLRGGWDAVGLIFFVGCGLSRLARYNVTATALSDERGKVRYFEGTPITTSLVIAAILAACVWTGRTDRALPLGAVAIGPFELHPMSLLYVMVGCAMVSKTLRIPKP